MRISSSSDCQFAIVRHKKRKLWGVQFHPEVHHTPQGERMLANFVLGICKARPNWKMAKFVDATIEALREEVGDRPVVCGVSAEWTPPCWAVLLHRAIGKQLTCVLVDNGLLREREAELVVARFKTQLGIPIKHVRATSHFLGKLKGVTSPERKRKIIARNS